MSVEIVDGKQVPNGSGMTKAKTIAHYTWKEGTHQMSDEEECEMCDEVHDDGECGLDFPDPDILYDEMNSAYWDSLN